MDSKYLRGARAPTASRVIVLCGIRHDDSVTTAAREIDARTNEIPDFTQLLDQIDDAVVTADALHAQHAHTDYLVKERGVCCRHGWCTAGSRPLVEPKAMRSYIAHGLRSCRARRGGRGACT